MNICIRIVSVYIDVFLHVLEIIFVFEGMTCLTWGSRWGGGQQGRDDMQFRESVLSNLSASTPPHTSC